MDDYHVTPMDKYAKASITIPHKATLEIAFKDEPLRISKDTVSKLNEFVPNNEEEDNEQTSEISLDIASEVSSSEENEPESPNEEVIEKPSIVKEEKQETIKKEEDPLPDDIPDVDERGYKQISIFDDFFSDDDE